MGKYIVTNMEECKLLKVPSLHRHVLIIVT